VAQLSAMLNFLCHVWSGFPLFCFFLVFWQHWRTEGLTLARQELLFCFVLFLR
jgi:hypothetical protein